MRTTGVRNTASNDVMQSGLIDLVGSRWALRILLSLREDQQRFTDLRRLLPGISANVLTQRLRELEAAGLVARDALPPPAACQVYGIGPLAVGLRPALDHLTSWLAKVPASLATPLNHATQEQE
jgi:DNA-binding HxlR family transcriptional regulator